MTEILPVIQLGHAVLRQSAAAIDSVHDPAITTLIENLMATLQQSNGVGIAAPQVAVSKRLFIVASRPNPRYPNAPEMEPTPMINPRLLSHSDEVVKDWEGCLSVPGSRGLIPRYRSIEVEFLNANGQLQKQELTNFVARIFQHELDHLDGLVFLDRLDSVQEIITDQEYLKLIQKP